MVGTVSGELKKWHKVTIDFDGPLASEESQTFLDYRMDVTFTHAESGRVLTIPGFFAADGDAGNTGASTGDIWRAHFTPSETGEWSYSVSFRTGENIAGSLDPNAGIATSFDGASGTFSVDPSDKTGDDLRAHGTLEYDGDLYLTYAESGKNFIKSGSGGPESFLAYDGFDNTVNTVWNGGDTLKDYDPHLSDWNPGDPTWNGGEGKGIIGAVNYMAQTGINSFYMMLNSVGGDSRNVHPWSAEGLEDIPRNSTDQSFLPLFQSYDVSKLAQWETVFEHMQQNGINLQFFLAENENDQLINNGDLGVEKAVFIREMIARFGHHNSVIWNFGEENSLMFDQLAAQSDYIRALDAYDHPLAFHMGRWQRIGPERLDVDDFHQLELERDVWDVYSVHMPGSQLVSQVSEWSTKSINNGTPQPLYWDEGSENGMGLEPDTDPEQQATQRAFLWEALTQGAAGVSWYLGPTDDLIEEDFRSRDNAYTWTTAVRKLWEQLPLEEMRSRDRWTLEDDNFAFADPGNIYVIYLPNGGPITLDLAAYSGTFDIVWFNPRADQPGFLGTVETVEAGSAVSLGAPHFDISEDWAVIVRRLGEYRLEGIDDIQPPAAGDPPDAVADGYAVDEDGTLTVDALSGLLANDTDPDDDPLTAALA
ncbi:MAG: DUF5060 domain-containing protein, partial [Pseudomonadota bacterium]